MYFKIYSQTVYTRFPFSFFSFLHCLFLLLLLSHHYLLLFLPLSIVLINMSQSPLGINKIPQSPFQLFRFRESSVEFSVPEGCCCEGYGLGGCRRGCGVESYDEGSAGGRHESYTWESKCLLRRRGLGSGGCGGRSGRGWRRHWSGGECGEEFLSKLDW